MDYQYQSSSKTHVGYVRSLNEDAFLDKTDHALWVVADGMGGHEAGDIASRLVVDCLDKIEHNADSNALYEAIKEGIYAANNELLEMGQSNNRINGTTVVAMFLHEGTCHYIWAGDSRLYLLRDKSLKQLTKDHSQAEIYVDLGMMTRDEASQHISSNLLTRAIGTDEDLELDSGSCELQIGDRFLLSSDGLDKHVLHAEIEQILTDHDRDNATDELIEKALENGGTDNITVSIIDIMAK